MATVSLYTVSVLIASMAALIIFLGADTIRLFPVEIFLSREVAQGVQCLLF